jgi:hypothetical protein
VALWLGFGLRSYGVHSRAHVWGVLSFDLEATFGPSSGRGLDRWNGVNRNRAKACTDLRLSCQLSGAVRMEVGKVV